MFLLFLLGDFQKNRKHPLEAIIFTLEVRDHAVAVVVLSVYFASLLSQTQSLIPNK